MKILSVFLLAISFGVTARSSDNPFIQNLDLFEQMVEVGYSSLELKNDVYSYDFINEVSDLRDEINSGSITLASTYQQKLIRLTNNLRDHHVRLYAGITERSELPFTVFSSGKGVYIASIDRTQLPESAFPSSVGDEVLEFDGLPIAKVISDLEGALGAGTNPTFERLAQKAVTRRYSDEGLEAKKGLVKIKVVSNGKTIIHQLVWTYKQECLPETKDITWNYTKRFIGDPMSQFWQMMPDLSVWDLEADLEFKIKNLVKYSLAERALIKLSNVEPGVYSSGYSSFVPYLGPVVWEAKREDFPSFKAYIYLSPERKLVGYVRIPSFSGGASQIEEMKKLVKIFNEKEAQGLAIDLINNAGGSLPYMYALLSLFAQDETGIKVLGQRMKIHNGSVANNATLLSLATQYPAAEVLPVLTAVFGGYPFSEADLYKMAEASKAFLNEYKLGTELSTPQYLYGIDTVLPNRDVVFKAPIILLTNTFGLSATDFFSAILVDNLRAKTFGERTGGAGGFVDMYKVPNRYWATLSLTGSNALRLNGEPVEDFGVSPSFPYEISVTDLKENYRDYKNALVKTLDSYIKSPSKHEGR